VKSAVETLSPTRVRLSVEVPSDELGPSLKQAYGRIASQISIPGFRKGKVPAAIIDQRVGRAAVIEEAVNDILPKAYDDAVKEHDLKPLGQPQVELGELDAAADGAPFTFTAEVDVRPEITLPSLEGVELKVDDAEVTDADVDRELDELRGRFGTLTPVERAVQTGDFVQLDLAASQDGKAIDDATATNLSYEVGSNQLVDGIDDAVLGLEAGGTATFVTRLAAPDYADKDVDVSVTVNAVKERVLPDLDDDFAQLASEFDTLQELRDAVRAQAGEYKKLEQGVQARDKLIEHLLEVVEVPIPENVVKQEIEAHFQDGHGDDAHRAEFEEGAAKEIRTQLILDEIAQQNELSVTEAELVEYLVRQSSRYGMQPDQFVQEVVRAGQTAGFVGEVVRAKALAHVLEQATVTDASGNPVDLSALTASPAGDADAEEHDHEGHEHEGHDHEGHEH
jgi:trigger factor